MNYITYIVLHRKGNTPLGDKEAFICGWTCCNKLFLIPSSSIFFSELKRKAICFFFYNDD